MRWRVRSVFTIVCACAVALVPASPALALCAAVTEWQHYAGAEVVAEGAFLSGETAAGTLNSPARFRVDHYLKGNGADVVAVTTGSQKQGSLVAQISTGIFPSAGERWRIFGDRREDGVVVTSDCSGSKRLARADRFSLLEAWFYAHVPPVAAAVAGAVATLATIAFAVTTIARKRRGSVLG